MKTILVLRRKVLNKIKTDPILFGQIASALSVSPTTLPRLLKNNDDDLTKASSLKILREHLGCQDNDLLNEKQVSVIK